MALKITKNSKDKIYKYIPIIERGESEPFTIEFRPLTSKELALLEDKTLQMFKDESVGYRTGTFNWEVCKLAIKDWDNLFDEDNKKVAPVKLENGFISEESLNLLPYDILGEIAGTIVSVTKDPENANLYLGNEAKEPKKTTTKTK